MWRARVGAHDGCMFNSYEMTRALVAELLDPANFREETWTFPWAEDRPIFFFELVGDTVWGATGAMLRQLLGLVTGTLSRGQLDHV